MPPVSAALCCYRRGPTGTLTVLLVHPGGPYFVHRDEGVWSIPKGLVDPGEEHLAAARREFAEEVGCPPPVGEIRELGEIRQAGGKRVIAFAVEGDESIDFVASNEFELEWPPGSGELQLFPECDRGGWFALDEARALMVRAQTSFLDRLEAALF